MCQGCVDDGSVSQFVYDVLEARQRQYPDSGFGRFHIVVDDSNVNDDCVRWCLSEPPEKYPDHYDRETATLARWLLTVPATLADGGR